MSGPRSKELFARAKEVIPGGVNSPVRAFRSVGGDPVFVARGQGAYLFDVDGKRYQDGSTRTMIFGIAKIVSYVSGFMSLQPGDVITTGTPPGNGMAQTPPVFLEQGNVMYLYIERLGEQRQRVVSL